MIDAGVDGVEFVAVNTDAQDLKTSKSKTRIQIGLNLTKGLGAGAKHEIGQAAADESLNDIIDILKGANMVFSYCGHGWRNWNWCSTRYCKSSKRTKYLNSRCCNFTFFI